MDLQVVPHEAALLTKPHWTSSRRAPAFFFLSDAMALTLPWVMSEGTSSGPLRAILMCGVLVWLLMHGHYWARVGMASELAQLGQAVAAPALIEGLVAFSMGNQWQVLTAAFFWTATFAALALSRMAARRALAATGLWSLPTLVVGGSQSGIVAAALASDKSLGYHVAGIVDLSAGQLRPSQGGAIGLGASADQVEREVLRFCRNQDIECAVLADGPDASSLAMLSQRLGAAGLEVAFAPSLSRMPVVGLQAQNFTSFDVVLLTSWLPPTRQARAAAKRLFDVVAASSLLVLLAPLMLVLAAMVRIDGGPALFGHNRVGRGGRSFRCLKFRTMAVNAEQVLNDMLAKDPALAAEWHQNHKLKDDPRVTRIGVWLRSSSLDELPQLFNVLRGDMSLVGPRPVTVVELDRYAEDRDYYLAVRPGITGLWQVSGRSDVHYGRRTRLDAWYVRNWSIAHDLVILARTVLVVIRGSGAY
ncbi:MAG TPA: exopolysaccharide biosynthesis polyprenyl glycosylphosphotransferase [Magnetospirillum sp.]|jgi:undecaprenyl-phosphate galactose phosphotransferase|nr:exopolysaccharide biosynthesis polyprenyl glycosylphosphotransferase [Magnetospirillum sp.]